MLVLDEVASMLPIPESVKGYAGVVAEAPDTGSVDSVDPDTVDSGVAETVDVAASSFRSAAP
jgi:hypothetical protein